MKVEEYLEKFKEYDQKIQDISNTFSKASIEFMKAQEEFEDVKRTYNDTYSEIRKGTYSLYKKILDDGDVYIKTGGSYQPEIDDLRFPIKHHIGKNINISKINNIPSPVPLVEYIEENAINVEDNESRELLKTINGEDTNTPYELAIYKRFYKGPKTGFWDPLGLEYTFRYCFAKDVSKDVESTLKHNNKNLKQVLVKFFEKRKDLNDFLRTNFSVINNNLDINAKKYGFCQSYAGSNMSKEVEKVLSEIIDEFEILYNDEEEK